MLFEFDPIKSALNHEKHGMDFIEAQQLWEDPDVIEVPARVVGEPRYLVVGRIGEKHWSAIVPYRDEKIRIISVRRSRPGEKEIYENA